MMYITLLLVVLAIIIFYLSALLVFTPYEEDDKYVLKILRLGYKLHLVATKKHGVFKKITDNGAKLVLTLVYYILKDRKYTDSIETKNEDEEDTN
ncbi:hypothetical protein DYH56_02730 [Psychrilyobacter piezotolerans]|uniref:Uncharacterized protein n=2 Tax=Fusobacteriaceae TaxID=203492 RepID=A0ABX9KK12_9FUSO|nr:hypothetical protein DV867_02730 [Psychrilyobacter sp. S5]REI42697.1 hypothetical protein DYH56_02730 [Psychrilyobacter piezotolerans]